MPAVLALALGAGAAAQEPASATGSSNETADARTEAQRLVAEERARLQATRAGFDAAAAELEKLRAQAEESREQALGWIRRVREIEARTRRDGQQEEQADGAYARLVDDLRTARALLGAALSELESSSTRITGPEPSDLPLRDPELEREREELAETARRMLEAEDALRWERVTARRDGVVTMNRLRLRLLPLTSRAKRSALRGIGPEAIGQAGREVEQIVLELRYHVQALPRLARARLGEARDAPLDEVIGFLQLAFLLVVFRWWRGRADRVLRELQARLREPQPPSPLQRSAWSLVWLLHRVRQPLEWLALVAILSRFPTVAKVPELGYLSLVLLWAFGGWFGMKLLDAAAARRGDTEGTGALRWRSLRLAGLSGVAIGLLLSVAERSVGKGTLYAWLSAAIWLVVPPLALVLVAWWRPIVFSRLRVREQRGALLDGVLARADRITSFPAAALGGLWLVGEGAVRFLDEQASRVEPIRRVLTWLFRREVERQEASRAEHEDLPPISDERRAALAPERRGGSTIEGYGKEALERALTLLDGSSGSALALVGERGIGKTTFLDRLLDAKKAEGALRVTCRPDGFDGLLAELWAAAGLDGKPHAGRLADHLRERRPPLVCVDDVQRIVRPVIGGLADVDRLLALTRAVGSATSWVVAIGKPGYGYLERARGGRVTFDEVLRLEPWTAEQIAQLVRERTREAGIEAGFGELVAGRAGDDATPEARRERTERDYHALLSDASAGNPSVALHAWRESLRQRPETGEVVVRFPDLPGADDLDDLPPSFFFILRAILQLELASEAEVGHCTDIRPADVADALRLARARGIVEPAADRTRISLHWYRAVTQSLRRRHLVAF